MTHWVLDWLRAFGLTLALETLVAVPLLKRLLPTPAPKDPPTHLARILAAIVLVNLATHPLVWFLFPGLSASYPVRVALSELWAFSAESAAYWAIFPQLGARRAFLVGVAANAVSFGAGWFL